MTLDADVSAALSAFNVEVAKVPSIETATSTDLIPIQTAGAALLRALFAAAAVQDNMIIANPLATSDGGVTSLGKMLAAIQAEVAYLNSQYYFGRALVNVQNRLE